MVLIEIILHP